MAVQGIATVVPSGSTILWLPLYDINSKMAQKYFGAVVFWSETLKRHKEISRRIKKKTLIVALTGGFHTIFQVGISIYSVLSLAAVLKVLALFFFLRIEFYAVESDVKVRVLAQPFRGFTRTGTGCRGTIITGTDYIAWSVQETKNTLSVKIEWDVMSQKMWNSIPDMFFVTPIMVGYTSRLCCVYILISRYDSYVGLCESWVQYIHWHS